MTDRNPMTDTLYILVMVLFMITFSLALSFGMGYLIGAGFAYLGWNVNPTTVAWLFFGASSLSYSLLVLGGRKNA